jgi:hypothetical protein
MSIWRKENVSRVLRDERYTGKIISGKMKKMAYGDVKTKLMPKGEWLVVADAHEPIVTQEGFDKVQPILGFSAVIASMGYGDMESAKTGQIQHISHAMLADSVQK